ncbi:MAG: hypothetical protein Q9204_002837 [Flavoplaca sp. TL-2023a]
MLLPLMLLSLFLPLTNSLPPLTLPTSPKSPILCFDPRYATQSPSLNDCLSIIRTLITPNPNVANRVRKFSRVPTAAMLRLPYTWSTQAQLQYKGESAREWGRGNAYEEGNAPDGDKEAACGVTIDMPGAGTEVAEATLAEIKEAAMEIVKRCVERGEGLGGIMSVGKWWSLQVTVEAFDETVGRTVGGDAVKGF